MDGTNAAAASQAAVTVSLKDLESGNIDCATLEEAFGPTSLGIIVVKDLPERFGELRTRLLSYASYLAHLDADVLESLASPRAKYLVGWSHGKEALKPGVFDTHKGSYYVNCAFRQDASLAAAPPTPAFPDFPEYTSPNVWPAEAALPGFRATFEQLCNLIIDTAVLVARACDRYAEQHIPAYQKGYLEKVVATSYTTKARLLHYFPPAPDGEAEAKAEADTAAAGDDDDDSWCATHLDHGCLTGLTSALYVDERAGLPPFPSSASSSASCGADMPPVASLAEAPDDTAGLYIRSRTGATSKVAIPAACLAFQTGEALERITHGRLRAVPHFVSPGRRRGARMRGIARNTLAVFTQPNLDEIVDDAAALSFGAFSRDVVARNA